MAYTSVYATVASSILLVSLSLVCVSRFAGYSARRIFGMATGIHGADVWQPAPYQPGGPHVLEEYWKAMAEYNKKNQLLQSIRTLSKTLDKSYSTDEMLKETEQNLLDAPPPPEPFLDVHVRIRAS